MVEMSEKQPGPEFPSSDAELESLLRNLKPSSPTPQFLDELERDHRRLAETDPARMHAPRWGRLAPLAVAACLVFGTYLAVQYRTVFAPDTPAEAALADTASSQSASSTDESTAPGSVTPPPSANTSVGGFVPVSQQGFLVDSRSGGVIETDEGPREKMNLEFRDAYHWHDPETNTNLRFFQPREEQVIVPLQTD